MNFELPEEYIRQQFFLNAGYPKEKYNGILEGGCPICHEGKSWGRKSRLYYIPEYNNLHCKNCNMSWTPYQWVAEVTGKNYNEIMKEASEYEYTPVSLLIDRASPIEHIQETSILPEDSINLSDDNQLRFYKANNIVRQAVNLIRKRRLNVAINKPDTFYVSLKDKVHKNRLCIPFYSDNNEIGFYQTRSILKGDEPKYLSKVNSHKNLFNENKISPDLDYLFIFEGPIDAMFVKNGTCMGGIHPTEHQKELLSKYSLYKQIWILDNQLIDETAKEQTLELIDSGKDVFLWDKNMKAYKDFNDICISKKINEIPISFILKNTFSGMNAKFQLKKRGIISS